MAKFFVTRGGPSPDETVEAEHCRITEVGALVFYVTESHDPEPGQRTYDRMVKAFAPDYWAEVERLGHVCGALPRHVHNSKGEPVYTPDFAPAATEPSCGCSDPLCRERHA